MLNSKQKDYLLRLARESILSKLENRDLKFEFSEEEIFNEKLGAFVTLKIDQYLRGCIGYVVGIEPLHQTIIDMARAAAFSDPRFSEVRKEEMKLIQIEISILSPLIEVNSIEEIKIGRDGLMIQNQFTSGLLLPQVAIEWNWDRDKFLEHTCLKAGLERDAWKSKENKLFRFSAEIFFERK